MKLTKTQQQEMFAGLAKLLLGVKIPLDIVLVDVALSANGPFYHGSHHVLIPANKKIGKRMIQKMVKHYESIELDPSPIRNCIRMVIDPYLKIA